MRDSIGQKQAQMLWVAAWGVHLYTAMGAVIAFVALDAVMHGRLVEAFWWLAAAMIIDCSDGTLARAIRVKDRLPQFDGPRLDDLVDYLNYVLVPVALLYHGNFLPQRGKLAVAAIPLLASAYGFCHKEAKTKDNFFRGFPSYWNVVAFYVFSFRLGPTPTALWILFLSAMVFVPLRFIYPSRTPTLRWLTISMGLVWAAVMVTCLWQLPDPPRSLLWASLVFPSYYLLVSLALQMRSLADSWRACRRSR